MDTRGPLMKKIMLIILLIILSILKEKLLVVIIPFSFLIDIWKIQKIGITGFVVLFSVFLFNLLFIPKKKNHYGEN